MLSKRQNEIIEKSILIIDEKGIQGLTIKNLSQAIGISESGIYRHFDSKFDILFTILNSFKEQLAAWEKKLADDNMEPQLKMKQFFGQVLNRFVKSPSLVSVIFSEEIFQNEERLVATVMEIQQMNEKIINNLIQNLKLSGQIPKCVDVEMFVFLFFGSMRQLVRQWKYSGHRFNLVDKGDLLFKTLIQALQI